MVQSAVRAGWRDARWMEQDPELRILRSEGAFRELVEEVWRTPKVRFEAG